MMTVRDLRAAIVDLPDDAIVIMQGEYSIQVARAEAAYMEKPNSQGFVEHSVRQEKIGPNALLVSSAARV